MKTKYAIGDKVWLMVGAYQIQNEEIFEIKITLDKISYIVGRAKYEVEEKELFESKEALIEYLKNL